MDGYQFIAAIFQSLVSLAWPAALVIIVLVFRGKFQELLPFLRLKHKDIEISFRLDKAEEEAKKLPAASEDPETQATPEERKRFEQVADISPRAAILEVRAELEQNLRELAFRHHVAVPKGSLLSYIRVLRSKNIIDSSTSALLDDLRAIGNQAAHAEKDIFTKEEATRVRLLADEVIKRINLA